MTTLAEAIAPDGFEICVTFPLGHRRAQWVDTESLALDLAREWCTITYPCVQITAYGTVGTPHDKGFALRNFEMVDGALLDGGWQCWLPGGRFIGPVD